MIIRMRDALAQRQNQWDAFHRWESGSARPAISLEERVAWFVSAFTLSRSLSAANPNVEEIQRRVRFIQEVRKRLAQLTA